MSRLSRAERRREIPPACTALVAALLRLRVRPEQLAPCDPALIQPAFGGPK